MICYKDFYYLSYIRWMLRYKKNDNSEEQLCLSYMNFYIMNYIFRSEIFTVY